jgi:H+/gluconate symporter-like permease
MSGLTEMEALKSWTPMLAVLGVTTFVFTLLLAFLLPLV